MKKLALVVLCGLVLSSCATLMAADNCCKTCCKKAQPLFGENLSAADYDPAVWKLNEQGELTSVKDSAIWTKEKIGDCKISLEYKLSSHSNAGILIKCSDKQNWIPNTIEIQLLDDAGTQPNYHGNAAFYGYQAPTKVLTKPAGEWNQIEITCKGTKIWVKLNGELVNEMDMAEWKDCKKGPNGTDIEGKFQGKALADSDSVGYVGLQGLHGKAALMYRNLKIEK